eukprot:2854286-Prymnesium_polylepis.1
MEPLLMAKIGSRTPVDATEFRSICTRKSSVASRMGVSPSGRTAQAQVIAFSLQCQTVPTPDGTSLRTYECDRAISIKYATRKPPAPASVQRSGLPDANDSFIDFALSPEVLAQLMAGLGLQASLGTTILPAPVVPSVDAGAVVRDICTELVPGASADAPLMDAGLDSLGAVEFANRLQSQLGDYVELPATLMFDFPTMQQMGDHLQSLIAPPAPTVSPVPMNNTGAHEARSNVLSISTEPKGTVLSSGRTLTASAKLAFSCGITIMGTSCKLPWGVGSVASLDRATLAAYDMVVEVPGSRWDAKNLPVDLNLDATMIPQYGAFVHGAQLFDHRAFGMSVAEGSATDPQARLTLEQGYAALHAMGANKATLSGSGTGVAVGIWTTEFFQVLARSPLKGSVYASTGASLSIAAGRVSFALGMQGPCMAIETACSASLVASHSAVRALQYHECDLHLAVGVNLMLMQDSTVAMAVAGMTSPTGRCYTFDQRADGFARGE